MERSEKINGKKKLPTIPSNYVTILQLQERWIKEEERKQKGKEEKEEPQQEQEEKETKFEERVHAVVAGRGSRKNGHIRPYDRENGKRVAEGKPRAVEIAAGFAVNEREDVEKEKKGEELKNEKKKKKKKWQNKKEEKARADDEGGELVGPAVNAPLPASIENNKGEEEEVIGDEVHAPKLASVEEENIVAKTESQPRIIPRTDGHTVEIGRKFSAMSMKSESGTGYYCRYGWQNGNFNHRGGNTELNRRRRYYGKFDRCREQNQRNEGMVWVKKGEVSDRNVSGIQSSSCLSKELD
ncbi:hypothetical protein CRYUN_Cryun28dG0071800 [Craigia yunnanensis]